MFARDSFSRVSYADVLSSVWERLEVVLERFEDSWRAGEQPALEAFLEGVGAERRALLIELVHADLHYRLKAGEAVRVESYLSRFPELGADDAVLLELVWQELDLRRRQDSSVNVSEYLERFPQLAERLEKRMRISTSPKAQAEDIASAGWDAGTLDLRDFELLDRLGQGGMGEVYRGRDPALGRNLAVKMLRTELRGSSEAERRFRLEALVTGALQHPNIVPVHNLGRLPDGRLYFTMKLVRGRTLAEMLAEGNGAGQRSELLGVFEKVCQAVAFAHSRGVIHRDLKPANVMVGAFGEVQVMDWGLAKVLRSNPGPENGSAVDQRVRHPDTPGADHQTGVVGTPAYMPPEQAGGTGDEMDERADVFGLGTILCEILTGRPPYSGDRIEQVLSQAASGDTTEALVELNECGADAELVALCRECLATERSRRSRNGQEVAERLLTYQTGVQDRLRKAQLERSAAEAREQEAQATTRAEHKALRRTQALAAAVLLALAAFGGVGWVLWDRAAQQAERAARTERTVRVALAKTQQLAEQASQMPSLTSAEAEAVLVVWRQADDALAQAVAVEMTGTANDELRQQVLAMQVQLDEQKRQTENGLARALRKEKLFRNLADARMAMATVKESHFDYAGAATKHQAAFAEYGIEVQPEQAEELGKRIRNEEPAVREALIVALDHWALCNRGMSKSKKLDFLAIARAADEDAWRREYRQAVVKGDGAALIRLSQEARHGMLPPESLELLAFALRESRKQGEALDLLRWARRRHPKDFWLAMELGNYLEDPKSKDRVTLEERIGCYRVAVALEPKATAAHNNLGIALHAKNQYDDAIEEFEIAIKLAPQEPIAYNNLGISLQAKYQYDNAITLYKKAIALDPHFANAHNNLGLALQAKNQLDAAIIAYQKAIEIEPKFVGAHSNLGLALHEKKQWDAAIAKLEETLKIDPNYAPAYNNLGQVLLDKDQLDDAITEFKKSLKLDPDIARAHAGFGWALFRKGQFNDGRLMIEKALSLISATDDLRPRLLGMRDQCTNMCLWEAKLLDVLAGKTQPKDNIERISLIAICSMQKRYAAAAKLYTAAFAADKKLAEDLHFRHRHVAAEHAARAAAGLGIDADKLNAQEKAQLRKLALEWLRGDFEQNAKLVEDDQPKVKLMVWTHLDRWPKSPAFASLRDKEWLDKYPEEERKLWREFWGDVDRLLRRIAPKKEVRSGTSKQKALVAPSSL